MNIFAQCLTLLLLFHSAALLIAGNNYLFQDNMRTQEPPNYTQEMMQNRLDCVAKEGLPFNKSCCKKCPKGEFLESGCTKHEPQPTCSPCAEGTYMDELNRKEKCFRCNECNSNEFVEDACTSTSNTKCQCKAGFYRLQGTEECPECSKCVNRETTANCSGVNDTQCGECLPGFYEENNECRSCSELPIGNSNAVKICKLKKAENPPILITIGAVITSVIIFGGVLMYCYVRRKERALQDGAPETERTVDDTNYSSLKSPQHVTVSLPQSQVTVTSSDIIIDIKMKKNNFISSETPLMSNSTEGSQPSALQQGKIFYDIINIVPARRWKEFMRTLELKDAEIERVEMEFPYFREQQYEMLKRWSQQNKAEMDSVYSALARMDLSGCAEELKRNTERGP
ncbi:tumor necrosis factor receptor superfamily member 25 [Lissotriton helveticus]